MVFVKNFFSTNTISVLSQQLLIHIPFTDSPVLRHPSHGFFVVDSLALVHLHVFFQSHLFPGFCQFFFLLGNALTLDHQHALALWFFHLIAGQPLIDYYKNAEVLAEVDGTQPMDAVFQGIVEILGE